MNQQAKKPLPRQAVLIRFKNRIPRDRVEKRFQAAGIVEYVHLEALGCWIVDANKEQRRILRTLFDLAPGPACLGSKKGMRGVVLQKYIERLREETSELARVAKEYGCPVKE